MKATEKNTSNNVDPKANYRAALAKALGKPIDKVTPVDVPEDKPAQTVVKAETFGHRTFKPTSTPSVESVIAAEVKKSKMIQDTLSDGTPIEVVYVDGGGKRIKEPTRTSPLQMSKIAGKKEEDEIAAAKDNLKAIKGKKVTQPVVTPIKSKTTPQNDSKSTPEVKKSLKDMTDAEKKEYYKNLSAKALAAKQAKGNGIVPVKKEVTSAPAAKPATNLLLAKKSLKDMTDAERKEYYQVLSAKALAAKRAKESGVTPVKNEATKTTDIVETIKKHEAAVNITNKTLTRKSSFERVNEIQAAKKDKPAVTPTTEQIKNSDKPRFTATVKYLSDYTLEELLAELKRRGCKGSIRVCTEMEL